MEIILNELSVEEKFIDLNHFLTQLKEIIEIYRLGLETVQILKPSNLYQIKLFDSVTFQDILTNRTYAMDDAVRRYKSIIGNMIQNDPFWDIDKLHNDSDIYVCDYTSKEFDYGIAEACERDKIILSFGCEDFIACDMVLVEKNNSEELEVINVNSKDQLLQLLMESTEISPLLYCKEKFKNTNISFDKINEGYGFESVTPKDIKIFISAFEQFSKMSWEQIYNSPGFKYKAYQPSGDSWFKDTPYENETIDKFRVTRKFRCFGYREGDIFYALRFEIDHNISDNG